MAKLLPSMYTSGMLVFPGVLGVFPAVGYTGGLVSSFVGAGFLTCESAQTYWEGYRAQVASDAAIGRANVLAPGAEIKSSDFVFSIASFGAPGVYVRHLQQYAPYGVEVTDTSGNFTITVVTPGVIDSVVDNYNKSWFITDELAGVTVPSGVGFTSDDAATGTPLFWQINNPLLCITSLTEDSFYAAVPTCGIVPPEPPAPPTLTNLPKFANFAMPINPFGIPRK